MNKKKRGKIGHNQTETMSPRRHVLPAKKESGGGRGGEGLPYAYYNTKNLAEKKKLGGVKVSEHI